MNIRKQVKFIFRYLTTPHRRRRWLKPSVLLVLFAFVLFMAAQLLLPAFPANGQDYGMEALPAVTITPSAPVEPTFTPLPPEFISNSQQTIGITIAGSVLVLIVVIGVIVYLPKNTEK